MVTTVLYGLLSATDLTDVVQTTPDNVCSNQSLGSFPSVLQTALEFATPTFRQPAKSGGWRVAASRVFTLFSPDRIRRRL